MATHSASRLPAVIVAGTIALSFGAARAQVLEIGNGGAVVVHDCPEVTRSDGATPISTKHASATRQAFGASVSSPLVTAAAEAGISPDIVEAIAWRESRGRKGLISRAGAVGEMQLMPGTARALGANPFDTQQNYRGGSTYFAMLLKRYDGDVIRALAAYNAGPGAVDRYGGVPPFKETRDYVASILDRLSQRVEAQPER